MCCKLKDFYKLVPCSCPYKSGRFFQDEQNKMAAVERDLGDSGNGSEKKEAGKADGNFGLTTPRNWGIADEPVMNKRLGIYQRPLSAHGIRNQQVLLLHRLGLAWIRVSCIDGTKRVINHGTESLALVRTS